MDDIKILPPFARELANLLGMDDASELDLHTRRKLANALKGIANYLLGRADDPALAESGDPLYRDVCKLTAGDRELANDFVKMLSDRRQKKESSS